MTMSDPGVARALGVPARAGIVRLLDGSGRPCTVGEIAEAVGLHVSTVRGHLDVLAGVGLVVRAGVHRVGRGRPRVLYAAPPGDGGDGYRRLAEVLAAELESAAADPARAALHAGERWAAASAETGLVPHPRGSAEQDLARVTDLLGRLGFQPGRPDGSDEIRLHRCPFEAAARLHPMIVCGVHLGLLRTAFERLGGRVRVDTLDSFVDGGHCVVRVRRLHHPVPEGTPA